MLDDIYELTTRAPTPLDVARRRRLAPEAVTKLDWHNDMSKLILDINERIEAAADDRARGVIIRRLRRALRRSSRTRRRPCSLPRLLVFAVREQRDQGRA